MLMVEDDEDLATSLAHLFRAGGFEASMVATGQAAITAIEDSPPDLLILDLTLPDMDGVEVCQVLRTLGYNGGLVIMSARSDELDVVAGLDAGADDYLVKPCSIAELQSRVRSVLRRVHRTYDASAQGLADKPVLEVVDHHITFDGEEITTRGREFDVLSLLIAQRGRVVMRETLMDKVWGTDWEGSPMVLSAAIGRIRGRLDAVGASEQVENVRGVGFRLSSSD
ncbi:response regulator transcription factor [Nocardioides hwasunensis]